MLSEYLGTDLSKVTNELDKLIISPTEANKITPDHIEKNIGISKDYNVFELQNALGERNVLKTNQITNHLLRIQCKTLFHAQSQACITSL